MTIHIVNKLITFLLISVMFSGCASMGPERSKFPLETEIDKETDGVVKVGFQIPDQQPEAPFVALATEQQPRLKAGDDVSIQLYRGTGDFVIKGTPAKPLKGSGRKRTYVLNFDNADLGEVIRTILGDTLGRNYTINPKVNGTVTIETSNQLTKDELLPTLEMLLRMNGAVLIRENALYRIEPAASALSGGRHPD